MALRSHGDRRARDGSRRRRRASRRVSPPQTLVYPPRRLVSTYGEPTPLRLGQRRRRPRYYPAEGFADRHIIIIQRLTGCRIRLYLRLAIRAPRIDLVRLRLFQAPLNP